MSAKSRTKGKSAELEVVHILRDSGAFPDALRDIEQVRGTDNGRDIIGTAPWTVQVKRRAVMTRGVVVIGIEEASLTATWPELPACIHRGDREPWKITCNNADLWWYCTAHQWCGRDLLIEMLLEEWCEVVRDVTARNKSREVADE